MGVVERRTQPDVYRDPERIKFSGPADLSNRFVQPSYAHQIMRVPVVRRRVVRAQLERAFEFSLGPGPVPIVKGLNRCQRNVSFREPFVELNSFDRSGPGLWESVVYRKMTVGSKHDIRVGNPGVSRSVTGIQRDRLLEVFKSLLLAFLRSLAPVIPPLQIGLISLGIHSPTARQSSQLLRRQLDLYFIGDGLGNVVLQGEDVPQVALVALSPYVSVSGREDELRRDFHTIPGTLHRALHDSIDIQFASNLW